MQAGEGSKTKFCGSGSHGSCGPCASACEHNLHARCTAQTAFVILFFVCRAPQTLLSAAFLSYFSRMSVFAIYANILSHGVQARSMFWLRVPQRRGLAIATYDRAWNHRFVCSRVFEQKQCFICSAAFKQNAVFLRSCFAVHKADSVNPGMQDNSDPCFKDTPPYLAALRVSVCV